MNKYSFLSLTSIILLGSIFAPQVFAKKATQTSRDILRVQVLHLDYSCWRVQSDSASPVFIEKHKPVKDLLLKINRCFIDRAGYTNPRYTVTVKLRSTGGEKTMQVTRDQWIDLEQQCYVMNIKNQNTPREEILSYHHIACQK